MTTKYHPVGTEIVIRKSFEWSENIPAKITGYWVAGDKESTKPNESTDRAIWQYFVRADKDNTRHLIAEHEFEVLS